MSVLKEQQRESIYFGDLTHMPNSKHLFEYLKGKKNYSILYVNLDNFKYIYDTYGHQYGDEFLKLVSIKVVNEIGNMGKVFCFFRNEFVVILDCTCIEKITAKVEVFIKRFNENIFYIGPNKVPLRFSVGIYIPNPVNAETKEEILRKADLAMLKAKRNGKNQFAFYDEAMEEDIKRGLFIAAEMKTGLKNNEFYLNYQPVYDLKEEQVSEVEALLRWRNSLLGDVSPIEFIPIAENYGYIGELGYFVLEEVCRQLRRWKKEGFNIKVAVNISPAQLTNRNFLPRLKRIIESCDIDIRDISFEITETQILKDEKENIDALKKLMDAGSTIVMDDSGVGFSSIKNFVFFPVSEIKIDRSFTASLLSDKKIETIIQSIIYAAKKAGYKVTIEGVEDEKQYKKAKEIGCDKVQGYYISRPVAAEEITHFFKKSNN